MAAVTVTPTVTGVTPRAVTRAVTCTVTTVTTGGVTSVTRHRHPASIPALMPGQGTAVTPTVTTDTVTPSPKEPAMTTTTDTRPAPTSADLTSRYPAIHGGPTLGRILLIALILFSAAGLAGILTNAL